MTTIADLAWGAWQVVSGVPWGSVLLGLSAWSLLSCLVALFLGRLIGAADRRADEARDAARTSTVAPHTALDCDALEEPDEWPPSSAQEQGTRRAPTRSGPFLIDRGTADAIRIARIKRRNSSRP